MPKKKTKKVIAAKTNKTVVVRSHSYGEHTRAARGSIKPAPLNAALAAKARQLVTINALASEIHTLLKQHAGFFKESMFWQKMLSRMHAAPAITPVALLESLNGLDLNSRYPLRRFGSLSNIMINLQSNTLTLQALNNFIPCFNSKVNMYRYDVIALFFNGKGKALGNVILSSKWFTIKEPASVSTFNVVVPKPTKLYVLCLRLTGGKNNELLNELSSQGMMVMKVGRL